MLIYNVTIKVDWSIHDEWLNWLKEVQIPEVLATRLFDRFQLVRLLEIDDEDGPTYAIQYFAPSKQHYDTYLESLSPGFRQKEREKWGNRFVVFETLMEIVN